MVNPWRTWDEEVKKTGRPSRVAQELPNPLIVALLRADDEDRALEKRLLGDEILRRLGRG